MFLVSMRAIARAKAGKKINPKVNKIMQQFLYAS